MPVPHSQPMKSGSGPGAQLMFEQSQQIRLCTRWRATVLIQPLCPTVFPTLPESFLRSLLSKSRASQTVSQGRQPATAAAPSTDLPVTRPHLGSAAAWTVAPAEKSLRSPPLPAPSWLALPFAPPQSSPAPPLHPVFSCSRLPRADNVRKEMRRHRAQVLGKLNPKVGLGVTRAGGGEEGPAASSSPQISVFTRI